MTINRTDRCPTPTLGSSSISSRGARVERRRARRAACRAADGSWCSPTSAWCPAGPTGRGRRAAPSPARSKSSAGPASSCSRATCSTSARRPPPDIDAALAAHPRLAAALAGVPGRAPTGGSCCCRERATPRSRTTRDSLDAAQRERLGGRARRACSRSTPACGLQRRARRARSPARSRGCVHRPARPQRSSARAAPRARGAPGARGRAATRAGSQGVEDADPAEMGSLVASRFAYRRLFRRAAWLTLPVLALLALFFPVALFSSRRAHAARARVPAPRRPGSSSSSRVVAVALDVRHPPAARRVELRVVVGARGRAATTRHAAKRSRSRPAGGAGLVTAHTRCAELTDLGGGAFYANCGSAGRVVERVAARAGLPPVYAARLRCSWVELEAGAELHVRLVARRPRSSRAHLAGTGRAAASASARSGRRSRWPNIRAPSRGRRVADATALRRRTRRIGATAIAFAGVVSLASAVTLPLAPRSASARPVRADRSARGGGRARRGLRRSALLLLAFGVRRGQRSRVVAGDRLAARHRRRQRRQGPRRRGSDGLAARRRVPRSAPRRLRGAEQPVVGAARAAARCSSLQWSRSSAAPSASRSGIRPSRFGQSSAAVAERLVGVRSIALAAPHRPPRQPRAARGRHRNRASRSSGCCSGPRSCRVPRRSGRCRASGRGSSSSVTATTRCRTSRCATTRSGSASATPSSRTGCTAGSRSVSPDPIGPVGQRAEAWAAFREFADEHGWPVAVMAACADWLPVYRASGMHDLYIGDEAVVDVRRFTPRRQAAQEPAPIGRPGARRRATASSSSIPSRLDDEVRDELRALMTESRRGDVERGFSMTLGRAFEPDDRGLLLAVAFDAEHRCRGVLPVRARPRDQRLVARPHAPLGVRAVPNGLTEFIVVADDRAPPRARDRSASRSTSRRSAPCSRARPVTACGTARRSGSSNA